MPATTTSEISLLVPITPTVLQLSKISSSLASSALLPDASVSTTILNSYATSVYTLTPLLDASSSTGRKLQSCPTCDAALERALQALLCSQQAISNCSTLLVECVKSYSTQQAVHFVPQVCGKGQTYCYFHHESNVSKSQKRPHSPIKRPQPSKAL